jgi:hypothetical protein
MFLSTAQRYIAQDSLALSLTLWQLGHFWFLNAGQKLQHVPQIETMSSNLVTLDLHVGCPAYFPLQ